VRIGTRGSALAIAQATLVGDALTGAGIASELVSISTAGDRRAPDTAWGEGAFVRAIEQALLDDEIDVAVHSAKDIPTDEHARLRIGAYLPREEPRDALVLGARARGTLDELPPGTVIGTDSPRRKAFVLARRPDLVVRPLHGNVDTRLRRLDAGEVDALILAAAGLLRLRRSERISQLLPEDVAPPAPGQGAIAVQARADDDASLAALAAIDDLATRRTVEAERAFLAATGGGCRAPVGALAEVDGERLTMIAGFAALDGRAVGLERIEGSANDADSLVTQLADRLLARRARMPGMPRLLVTRPLAESRRLAARLSEFGIAPVIVPAIEIELLDPNPELDDTLASLSSFAWAVATSPNAARAVAATAHRPAALPAVRWAAVGRATARALASVGIADAWLPTDSTAADLAEQMPLRKGDRVLWLRGSLADGNLIERLGARGAQVVPVTVYRTREAPEASRPALAEALADGPLDGVVLASPSAVRGILALAGDERDAVAALPAICVGPRTAAAAREAGFNVAGEASSQDATSLAELAAELLAGSR
jgi:hydroxymethylbilane synthase